MPDRPDKGLWDAYRSEGTEVRREALVRRYLPLVKFVVGRMAVKAPPGLDYEDMLSFGAIGLLDAIERFEPERGFSFQTFAVPRIRGAVLDELRKYDWISRTGREKLQRLERVTEELLQEYGAVSEEELMKRLEMDETAFRELLEVSSRSYITSLDETVPYDEGEVSKADTLMSDLPSAQDRVEHAEALSNVQDALTRLSEREQLVLALYYQEGLTLKEIGITLGVTESRVSQIHGKALATVRAFLKPE